VKTQRRKKASARRKKGEGGGLRHIKRGEATCGGSGGGTEILLQAGRPPAPEGNAGKEENMEGGTGKAKQEHG